MEFPVYQAQDTNFVSGGEHQLSLFDNIELWNVEDDPLLVNLQFPSLEPDARNKRPAHGSMKYPAKRRKAVSLILDDETARDTENNSGIDSFLEYSFPQEVMSFETAGFSRHPLNRQDICDPSELVNKELLIPTVVTSIESARRISPPLIARGHVNESQHKHQHSPLLEVETFQQDRIRHITPAQQTDSMVGPSAIVSSLVDPSESGGSRQAPQIRMSQQKIPSICDDDDHHLIPTQQQTDIGILGPTAVVGVSPCPSTSELGVQTPPTAMPPQQQMPWIYSVESSKEPTLLTLTSYPFRVVYSNQAFSKLRGRTTSSVVGDSVFDVFEVEGRIMRPCIATYPTLQGRLENHVALVSSSAFTSDEDHEEDHHHLIRCGVQADPVMKDDSRTVRYFAVRFTPIDPPPNS